MADALVSNALEKLTNVLGQQLALFAGATGELRRLQKTFQRIKAVLNDAESKQTTEESVHLWLLDLRQVSYDIDDLLDKWLISGLEKDGSSDDDDDAGDRGGGSEVGNRVCSAACLPLPYTCMGRSVSHYKVAHKIKEIRERLDEIAKDKDQFNTIQISDFGGGTRPVRRSRTMTSSHMNEEVIGRDDDKDAVISRLVSGSSSGDDGQKVQVIAIVGIGGLGKTTLARKIYHDGNVQGHFKEFLYWVCVSEDFDLKRLTKAIIEQVKGKGTSLSELDSLQKELMEALKGKRFLLVLDDVWNDDKKKWNMLQPCLTSGAPGSRILVTTRLQKVATNTMNAAHIHELKGLSNDHSWILFSSIAFDGRKAEECLQLERVGRDIVIKCKGVPLLITVMGSVMNSKRTVEDWQNILDSKMWSMPEAQNKILPALWLSYYNLPPHLKQCFVYCSIYPKDRVMGKDELIKLWIAQDFVQPQGNREIEDIGADYFDDLVAWSMLQKFDKHGETICTMHDLLHDLAQFIAKDEVYTFINTSEGGKSEQYMSSGNVRHAFVSFFGTHLKPCNIPIASSGAQKLRTLLLNGVVDGTDSIILDLFYQARFLRALIFMGSKMPIYYDSKTFKLPNTIGKLKHLRYLDLSYLNMVELPESVSHLRNLHTFNLTSCVKLKRLPSGMGGMVSLRHLEIEETDRLEYLPKGLGRMSCLRSLCKFIVRGGEGGGCGIDELQQLNSLHGSLEILYLERVSSREEAEKAELQNKPHLRRLVLRTSGRDVDAETELMDNVLEGLRPHSNLEELELYRYKGSKLPSWIEGMPCLRKLKLYICPKLEGLPHHLTNTPFLESFEIMGFRIETLPDGGWERLVALQKLEITYCNDLKCLPDGLTQLQSLKDLHISYCDKLGLLPAEVGQLKKLNSLTIKHLQGLTSLPDSLGQLESLEHLEISFCKKLSSLPQSLGQLKKLKSLTSRYLHVLMRLPDSLGELESLEYLEIRGLEKLESLPDSLGQLNALNYLEIWHCRELGSLPHGLQQLSLLRELKISNCPLLLERCKGEGGMDWPSISHVPNIYINGTWIRQ